MAVANTRSTSGCGTCKTRRVKCDEVHPNCLTCTRLGLSCSYVSPTLVVSNDSGEVRTQRPCEACTSAKRKCEGGLPSCSRCLEKRLECIYRKEGLKRRATMQPADVRERRDWQASTPTSTLRPAQSKAASNDSLRNLSAASTEPGNIPTASQATGFLADHSVLASSFFLLQHIDAYFANVHPVSYHGFLNKALLLDLESPYRTRGLLLAVCSIASPWVSSGSSESACAWAKEARHLLMDEMLAPTTLSLAMCLLLVLQASSRSQRPIVWTLSSMATRLAYALQLNVEARNEGRPWVEQEGRRRLMWAAYCLDKLVCRGNTTFLHLKDTSVSTRLPCKEELFSGEVAHLSSPQAPTLTDAYASGQWLNQSQNTGLLAEYILILDIRDKILSYVREGRKSDCQAWSATAEFARLRTMESSWRDCLNPSYHLSKDNIIRCQATGQLSLLLSIHMWHWYTLLELLSVAVHQEQDVPHASPEAFMWTCECWDAFVAAAESIPQAMAQVRREVANFRCADAHLGIWACQAARCLLQCTMSANHPLKTASITRDTALQHIMMMQDVLQPSAKIHDSVAGAARELRRIVQQQGLAAGSGTVTPQRDERAPADQFSESDIFRANQQLAEARAQQNEHQQAPIGDLSLLLTDSELEGNHFNNLNGGTTGDPFDLLAGIEAGFEQDNSLAFNTLPSWQHVGFEQCYGFL